MSGIFRSLFNLERWRGAQPNVLISGRVDVSVGVNNDKTGTSLTPGSYSVRASSTQAYETNSAGSDGTATISAVTLNRAQLRFDGVRGAAASGELDQGLVEVYLSATTTVTSSRYDNGGADAHTRGEVGELF